ncbi:MAG TPA: hypothetical protein VH208_03890, partial [Myxococcaceae bacterium]|nr:hypothetical protein [Myxococcaceae bacterium]
MAMLESATPQAAPPDVKLAAPDPHTGFRPFELGKFRLRRDEYFVVISWPTKQGPMEHRVSADAFLRALMRDVAWGFFYGLV